MITLLGEFGQERGPPFLEGGELSRADGSWQAVPRPASAGNSQLTKPVSLIYQSDIT
jgi:hypothetical protein